MTPRQQRAQHTDRALLQATKEVLATDGAHASVAAIAARANVGIGSLYRRWRTKEELFQHLLSIVLDQYLETAETALGYEDPWEGLRYYISTVLRFGPGLAPIAGTITITAEITAKNTRSDNAVAALIDRAHAAGVLRPDVTVIDIELLIEQLNKSPLLDQLAKQGRDDLLEAAHNARARITAIALDGLRAGDHPRLPGQPPGYELFAERWSHPA